MSQTKPYRPCMRVKITLTTAMQNKLLFLLSEHLGIRESYSQPHVIYMQEAQFLKFMFAAQKGEHKVTFEQLKAEYVDMKKEPIITMVRKSDDVFHNYELLEKLDDSGLGQETFNKLVGKK